AVRTLGALTLAYLCLIAPLAPEPLVRFPPVVGIALPWLAMAIARGALMAIDAIPPLADRGRRWLRARRNAPAASSDASPGPDAPPTGRARRRAVFEAAVCVLALAPGAFAVVCGPSTLAAYASVFAGGTHRAVATGRFPLVDSSIASLAADAIDRLGLHEA